MKTNRTILTVVALLVAFSLNAQVAINTDGSSPDASTMLDIQSSSSGTSFSNLDIADMSTAAPVTSPKTGLIAYNTNATTGPGFVMWNGTKWVTFEIEGINWKLLGNAGAAVATNFLGTTDYNSLAFRSNNIERMRLQRTGVITVHTTSSFSNSSFFVLASSSANTAIDGYATGSGDAIRAYNAGTGSGLYGRANYATEFGVYANNDNTSGTGLIASGNNQGGSYLGSGTGVAASGADGVYGKATDSDGTGIIGVGNNGGTSYTTTSGSGGAFTGYHGVFGKGRNTSNGIGVIGVGNDSTMYHYIAGGSGGVFSGAQTGVYGYATKTSDGTGVVGVGNRSVTYKLHTGIGSGGAFISDVCGVYGYASNTSGDRYGGLFEINGSSARAYTGADIGGTIYKTVGNGAASTIVKNLNEQDVIMYCPEAPEVLFQDYGIGQLNNGKTHITLDPVLAKNISVNENHPMKVFVTLEGDCNGIYITNKSANGFDVIELQGGSSNVTFSWQIVATRANEEFVQKDGSVEVSDYSKRFPPGPGKLGTKEFRSTGVQQKALQQKTVDVKDAELEVKAKEEIEDTEK